MKTNGSKILKAKVSKIIPAPKWKILRMISRAEHFPQFMPNVKECTVIERGRNTTISHWKVEVDNIPIQWKERAEIIPSRFTIRFKSVEGDLEDFEGTWQLRDHGPEGTEVMVEATARIAIPQVGDMIGDVMNDKLTENFQNMLDAFGRRLSLERYKNIRDRRISKIAGFSVVCHPYNYMHLLRYLKSFDPGLKLPSQEFLAKLFELAPSYRSFDIKDFTSAQGNRTNGYFIMCPIIPDMIKANPKRVVEKVIEACTISEQLGVGIVVLGGFTSIAGELYGKSLSSTVNVPMTTGNTLTTSLIVDGIVKACACMGIDIPRAKITIIGGTGDIGSGAARVFADMVAEVTITSRSEKNLMEAERILSYSGKAHIRTSRNNNEAIKGADIVLAAASVPESVIDFNNFKPGSVICDVGYPKNISYTLCNRKDILIFSGGICSVPTEFNLGFDIGLPNTQVLYGCFSEGIVLSLENRYENFSWGKGNITKEKVNLIRSMAEKHGFTLAPFFWGNRLVTEEDIEHIKKNASNHG